MKYFLILSTVALLTSGCVAGNSSNLKFELDDNTRPQDYSYITDPTGTFEQKVHRFQIINSCGSNIRRYETDVIGDRSSSDCDDGGAGRTVLV